MKPLPGCSPLTSTAVGHAWVQALRPKVFGVGMYRTGTSSLGLALSWLGYRTTSTFIPITGKNGRSHYRATFTL